MRIAFEELDFVRTDLGELLLRRRKPICMPDTWVYEVKLDDRFLMSSLVNDSERELARLALERLAGGDWRVLVGGLGLGHTAAAVLESPRVASLEVVEFLPEVIDWHRRELVPLAAELARDPRCSIVQDDGFRRIRTAEPASFDAVLIDIDDSPEHLLDPAHAAFYSEAGLTEARRSLRPGGVFGLWTAGPTLPAFLERLRGVFARAEAEEVSFQNPLLDLEDTNAIYIALG